MKNEKKSDQGSSMLVADNYIWAMLTELTEVKSVRLSKEGFEGVVFTLIRLGHDRARVSITDDQIMEEGIDPLAVARRVVDAYRKARGNE